MLSKIACKEITKTVHEMKNSAAFREFISTNLLGSLCMRAEYLFFCGRAFLCRLLVRHPVYLA
jgi:hypothetical protein